jgi:hypothetical protein
MRYIIVRMVDNKYITEFNQDGQLMWQITSYIIVTHEIMVDWIEKGIHPEWTYT